MLALERGVNKVLKLFMQKTKLNSLTNKQLKIIQHIFIPVHQNLQAMSNVP